MIKLSTDGVILSSSNALRFARTDNQSSNEQTLFNRLTSQYSYPNVDDNWNFFQKFKATDIILTQIASIYTINSFKVYDKTDDSLVETIAIPTATETFIDATYGTVNWYDIEIDTSLYGDRKSVV